MVEVDAKLAIVAVIALAVIYIFLIIYDHDSEVISTMIVGLIGMVVGVLVPSPIVDNRRGVLRW